MTDLERGGEQRAWGNLITDGLQPEVVRYCRRSDKDKAQASVAKFHCISFLMSNQCSEPQYVARLSGRPQLIALVGPARSGRFARGATAAVLLLLLSLAIPQTAQAHGGTGLAGGFVAGFAHPVSGLDHMLAMISVGLWGAFLGRPLLVTLPMLFPGAMAVGGALGMSGVAVPPVELGIAASVVTLGLMVLFAVRANVAVACAVIAVFALFHGYAHGQELPSAADPVGYSAGFVLCTGLLHLAGIALGTLKSFPAGETALRAGGCVIALFGMWFLARALGL